ncbi:GyrI-like domain-containing protein [Roseomonas sp. CCTCC AB2023176]|uniref:AraC family transcriptional regulator n=1 Tax=Roseomonas sp. CCTCC AB2023176 TaxID=3342640 RepID=UPI0035DD9082
MPQKQAAKPATLLDHGARIARAMALIARDPARAVPLEELAEAAAFSPCHFHRIYRHLAGETPAETRNRLRLSTAAAELVRGQAPVAQVAKRAGFSGAATFTRAFAAAYGIPPAAYRARRGLGAVLRQPTLIEEAIMAEVTIRTLPALRLAVLPHRGPYTDIGSAFDRIAAWAAARGLVGPDSRFFARYFDDPGSVPDAQLRSEAGLTVPPHVTGDGEVRIVEVSALRAAVLRYQGPYAELEGAYTTLYRDWLPTSGEEPSDEPCLEEYLNDPKELPPAEWLTDVILPLRERVPA